MEEMEYLKLQTRHLKVIDLKDFNFPKLSYYLDQNRSSDDDPSFSVWFHVPGDHNSHYIYSSSNSSEWDTVRAEIRIWSGDPKKYWKQALKEAQESQMAMYQSSLQILKERVKPLRRDMKKLEAL